jgi:hypothetical protein
VPGAGDEVHLSVRTFLEHQGVGLGHVHLVGAVAQHGRVSRLAGQRAADDGWLDAVIFASVGEPVNP